MSAVTNTPPVDTAAVALRPPARLLASATIAWSGVGAVVALLARTAASAGTFIGFGLDATIEPSTAIGRGAWRDELLYEGGRC